MLQQYADVTLFFSIWASHKDRSRDIGEVKDHASHEPMFV